MLKAVTARQEICYSFATMKNAREKSRQVLSDLLRGNSRFATGESIFPNYTQERRRETADQGQKPVAAVIACADSRVPVEAVFDVGIGDLFVIRVAGNVCGSHQIASVEFALAELGVPLVINMGHGSCGAVEAALSGARLPGALPELIGSIRPAIEKQSADHLKNEAEILNDAVRANVLYQMEQLIIGSELVRQKLESGEAELQGMVYQIASGRIAELGRHPREAALLSGE